MKHPHTRHYSESERKQERERPEQQSAPQIQPEMIHINFQAGKKHQVKQPHLPEQGKGGVVCKYIESIRPDHHAGNYHAYDMRDFQLIEQQRRKKDYHQDD